MFFCNYEKNSSVLYHIFMIFYVPYIGGQIEKNVLEYSSKILKEWRHGIMCLCIIRFSCCIMQYRAEKDGSVRILMFLSISDRVSRRVNSKISVKVPVYDTWYNPR